MNPPNCSIGAYSSYASSTGSASGQVDTWGSQANTMGSRTGSSESSSQGQRHSRGEFVVFEDEVIGEGGFGTVYKAFQTTTGAHVAAKVLHCSDPNASMVEVEKEVKMLCRLQHVNVVQILGYDLTNHPPAIFMEWMPVGSIQTLMGKMGGMLPKNVIARYGREMLHGLHYLHKHKVLHRDIKPANILIGSEGSAKLADFGLCKQLTSSSSSETGTLAGTVAYLSPEAVNGKYGPGSDMWAFGCTLLEMATGQPPWSHLEHIRGNGVALLFHIGNSKPPEHHPRTPAEEELSNFPALTPDLLDVIRKCFDFDRKRRPPAKDLLQHPFFESSQFSSPSAGSPVAVVTTPATSSSSPSPHYTPHGSFQQPQLQQPQYSTSYNVSSSSTMGGGGGGGDNISSHQNMDYRCGKGHLLGSSGTTPSGVACDTCQAPIPRMTPAFLCQPCKVRLCAVCAARPKSMAMLSQATPGSAGSPGSVKSDASTRKNGLGAESSQSAKQRSLRGGTGISQNSITYSAEKEADESDVVRQVLNATDLARRSVHVNMSMQRSEFEREEKQARTVLRNEESQCFETLFTQQRLEFRKLPQN